ncbi:MAG: hypothetical protein AAGJ81_06380 [Verrucomicrobiota bacterium]
MNLKPLLLCVASSGLFLSSSFSASEAGDGSARYYESRPDSYDGKQIELDCTFVTRINGGPQIEGVVLFLAHTEDEENSRRGGAIVTAVMEDDADSFIKRYGDTVDVDRGTADRIDSRRLKGTFYVLDRGHVYVDASENGEAHELILERAEDVKTNIRRGKAGGPRPMKGPKGRAES